MSIRRTALLALATLTLLGCDRSTAPPPAAGMPPAQVYVVTVKPKTIPAVLEYTGRTMGSREVEVRARVTGILLSRNFSEGDRVKAGQSLFTIDPAPFETAMARAEADVAAAAARLVQASREVVRLKPLHEARAISSKSYDDAVSAEQIAAADIEAAKARLREAGLDLGWSRVSAPISGIAGREFQSEGSLVSGPDVLLTKVTQIDPLYVIFSISDNEQLKLRREVEAGRMVLPSDNAFGATVMLADGSTYSKRGRVNFFDIHVSTQTGTSEVRADIPNGDGTLKPGQFVRVRLSGATRPHALLVPQRAVMEGPKGKFVYVVNAQNAAEIRSVEAGDWVGDEWVINSGLKDGDRVIVDGVMRIGPGAPVEVISPDAAPAAQPK